jgi:hypothetical protein
VEGNGFETTHLAIGPDVGIPPLGLPQGIDYHGPWRIREMLVAELAHGEHVVGPRAEGVDELARRLGGGRVGDGDRHVVGTTVEPTPAHPADAGHQTIDTPVTVTHRQTSPTTTLARTP